MGDLVPTAVSRSPRTGPLYRVNVYDAQIVPNGRSTKLGRGARNSVKKTSLVSFKTEATVNVISYRFACRLLPQPAVVDCLKEPSVLGIVLEWELAELSVGKIFRTLHRISLADDMDLKFAPNWSTGSPALDHSRLPPPQTQISDKPLEEVSARRSVSQHGSDDDGDDDGDSASSASTVSRRSTEGSNGVASTQGGCCSEPCGSAPSEVGLRVLKRPAQREPDDPFSRPKSKRIATISVASQGTDAPEEGLAKDTETSTASSQQEDIPETKLECTCDRRLGSSTPIEWSDEGSKAREEFEADPAHKFWTWDESRQRWFHRDDGDGSVIWFPLQLD